MMRGLAVVGPRPSQGIAAQIKNADIEDVSQLGVELLRAAGFWIGSTAVDSSKSRPSRDVDRSAGSTDPSRSREHDRSAQVDPKPSLGFRRGNWSSCPTSVIAKELIRRFDPKRAVIRRSGG